MRRAAIMACLAACLAVPAASRAGDPPGYTPIGPPATLNDIVFAGDGTIYGTTDPSELTTSLNAAVLWRSTDHGGTWKATYRLPTGWHIDLYQVSPADPGVVYASVTPARRGSAGALDRIDVRTGRAVPLSLGSWLGVDGAGTAYGATRDKDGARLIVRCRRRADACDSVPFPAFQSPPYLNQLLVDPNAAGVLVAFDRVVGSPLGWTLEVSGDSGGTWTQGAPTACCNMRFGGPGPRTLYSLSAGALAVSHDAGLTWAGTQPVPPGALVLGAQPAVSFGGAPTDPITFLGDGGRTASAPISGQLILDPTDQDRLFVIRGDETRLSADGGRSWRDIADARFGVAALDGSRGIAGSGSYLYAVARESIWFSHDRGATWLRTERPIGSSDSGLIVSRDDPRVAYGNGIRTLDGGVTWQAITPSGAGRANWIAPGDPLHLFAIDNYVSESVDGGQTWSESPQAHWCVLEAGPDPASPTGSRLRCNGFWTASDPLRPLPAPVPYVPGLVSSPDLPGAYAVALPRGIAGSSRASLLGELTSDWSWASLLGQTGSAGPSDTADAVTAWPAAGGTTFYAWDEATSTSWVRRGPGRWWRLHVSGRSVMVFAALDATHALVGTPGQYGERGVVDLAQPSLAPPVVQPAGAGLTCMVSWSAADAETTAYAWLRDGASIAGASGAAYSPVAGDAGHALGCRVTARTDFGASTVTSDPPAGAGRSGLARAPAVVVPRARGGHAVPVSVTP
jgi:hypothetical protein